MALRESLTFVIIHFVLQVQSLSAPDMVAEERKVPTNDFTNNLPFIIIGVAFFVVIIVVLAIVCYINCQRARQERQLLSSQAPQGYGATHTNQALAPDVCLPVGQGGESLPKPSLEERSIEVMRSDGGATSRRSSTHGSSTQITSPNSDSLRSATSSSPPSTINYEEEIACKDEGLFASTPGSNPRTISATPVKRVISQPSTDHPDTASLPTTDGVEAEDDHDTKFKIKPIKSEVGPIYPTQANSSLSDTSKGRMPQVTNPLESETVTDENSRLLIHSSY